MAKIRGFVLTMDKIDTPTSLISTNFPTNVKCDEALNLGDYIVLNCEKNEGL